jgi:hypothetical protein
MEGLVDHGGILRGVRHAPHVTVHTYACSTLLENSTQYKASFNLLTSEMVCPDWLVILVHVSVSMQELRHMQLQSNTTHSPWHGHVVGGLALCIYMH